MIPIPKITQCPRRNSRVINPNGLDANSPCPEEKNDDIRICRDFKVTLNNILEEHYILPRVEDMVGYLDQGEQFSKIDLHQVYLTLPIKQERRKLATSNTQQGLILLQ
ncbi:hypothetical protein PoB_000326100 [Plakobranchus ocellatus]|uniref:Reverse transcriptase domain-containing protein n=1 Tax=Plakobranchus ocellatus TaxID=259542 RepID=A0AAV3Y0X4_9GAST|nr:hypothetical protein PoB_000326100 [Plakobranchus ocellatus]